MEATLATAINAEEVWTPRAPRAVTTLLLGSLLCEDGTALPCRVRNISSNGMQVESHRQLEAEAPVAVQLRVGGVLMGKVAWCNGNRMGVALTEGLDLEKFLREVTDASNDVPARRAPRFEIETRIRISLFGRPMAAMLENISQSGARLRPGRPLTPGQQVAVTLPGMPTRGATVRWTEEDRAGISFLETVAFGELADWLIHTRLAS